MIIDGNENQYTTKRNIHSSIELLDLEYMKLNKIIIKNFRSYYGENSFELSDGLTLVIGDNGDGKTTFLRRWNGCLIPAKTIKVKVIFPKCVKRKWELERVMKFLSL